MRTTLEKVMDSIPGLAEYVDRVARLGPRLRRTSERLGVVCPDECGACCQRPSSNIQVSVFEALPLACHLWATGRAESVLAEIAKGDPDGNCHFYRQTGSDPAVGHCSIYPYRFLVCRFFNQSYRRRKDGELEFLACRLFRNCKGCASTASADAVVAADEAETLIGLNPQLATRTYPVNEAVVKALEYVGMRLYLTSASSSVEEENPDDPEKPLHTCA